MSVLDKYIYKNCFELNNKNHDINNYLFDASFSNQSITDEKDCAEYAYYNNHPSFFFQKKNNNGVDVSKCYVFKYENINSNDPDVDKNSQINNITKLNYDLYNNKNLPRYNFTLKEINTVDSNVNPTDAALKCINPGSLSYYLMKSFSNSYDINYNNITKRAYKNGISQHINFLILNEYSLKIDNDDTKKQLFNNNYVTLRPYFKHLYHNDIGTSNMYYDMISSFINNTLYVSSIYGIGFDISNTIYEKNSNSGSSNYDKSYIEHISKYGASEDKIKYFESIVQAHPIFLGLPKGLYDKHYSINASLTESNSIFEPDKYWEKNIHTYINNIFFIFLIYRLHEKADEQGIDVNYETLKQHLDQSDSVFNTEVEYDNNNNQNYTFKYIDIIFCLNQFGDDTVATELFLYTGITRDKVSKFLLYLLVYRYRFGASNTTLNIENTSDVANEIKKSIHPDIIEKFMSIDENEYDNKQCFGSFYKMLLGGSINTATNKYIKIFKKMYTGEFRLDLIQIFFIYRMKQLEDENTIIKNDIANMKTYIDNIYLHSKLNNIENYIYNEKSQLKYLFNKNSSEKQKNYDLNFLNNFVLVENITICIIMFILILFFIKK